MSENERDYEAIRKDNVRLVEGLIGYLEEYYLPKLDEQADKDYGQIIDSLPEGVWLNDLNLDELAQLFKKLTEFAQAHGVEESEITTEKLVQYKLASDRRIQAMLNRLEKNPKDILKGDEDERSH